MITLRPSQARGHADHGWLKSFHTFSFADYYDPNHRGFRNLRVINQDYIAAGTGFPTHPHHDMEIITYMVAGSIAHRDSMGNTQVIERGEVQYMSAGTGVTHSEFNPNPNQPTELLQIWIIPQQRGLAPAYGQKNFTAALSSGKLTQVLSPDGAEESVQIQQDARLWVAWAQPQTMTLPLLQQRYGWLQVVRGEMHIAGETLKAGDAVALSDLTAPKLEIISQSEFLFFDLA